MAHQGSLTKLDSIILIIVPTGSDKSTTTSSFLQKLSTLTFLLMTVEDGVNYDIEGEISHKKNLLLF